MAEDSRDVAQVRLTIDAELVDAGVDEAEIGPNAALADLGLDSLDMAQILAAIKTQHGVVLETPDVQGLTVAQLADRVVSLRAA